MQPVLKTPQPAHHSRPVVRAASLAHLIFERPDLELAERFLTDFGLVVVQKTPEVLYLRGAGPAAYCYRVHRAKRPRFAGFGLTVAAETDLRKLAGENLLRVFAQAETVATRLQRERPASIATIGQLDHSPVKQ